MVTQQRAFKEAIPAVLLVTIVVMFSNMSRTIMAPLLYKISEEYQLSPGPASRLYLIISIGFSISLLTSGYVSSKISHRSTIFLSSIVLFCALVLIGFSTHLIILQVGMVLVGIGAGLYPASGLSLLHGLIHSWDRQKAYSLHEIGPHSAMLLAPLVANVFLTFSTWRIAYVVVGVSALVFGMLFYFRIDAGYERGHPPTMTTLMQLLKNPSFLLMILLIGLGLGSMQGVYTLMPLFLVVEGGLPPTYANTLFGLSRAAPLISLLTLGWIPDRIGVRRSIRLFLLMTGTCTIMIGLLKGPLLILFVFLQPAIGALIVPAALGVIQDINRDTSVSVTFSFMLPISTFIATGIVPSFLGFMGDFRSIGAGFLVFGIVMMVVGLAAVYGIPRKSA